jgi:hypothetical protein
MFVYTADTALILGAGFSKCAGIPLQGEFSGTILSDSFNTPADLTITKALKEFLASAFYWTEGSPLPSLEDIFTMIDLSAGSGHNLGRKLTPKLLRAIRRMLIYRVFSILDQRFDPSKEISALLQSFIPAKKPITTHFVVLNWDIVLERHLQFYDSNIGIDYCVQALEWSGEDRHELRRVGIAKVHGSSNWVYCDNCKSVFYDRYRKLSLSIHAGLIKADFRLFDESVTDRRFSQIVGISAKERNCRLCQASVGPHIATFSFKKSFRTHAFASSWLAAEKILTDAKRWIFIGYSLPDADYEFKHLLKTTHLKYAKGTKPQKVIEVVLLDDTPAEGRYRTFFGQNSVVVTQAGLADYVARL